MLLEEILAHKRLEIEQARAQVPLEQMHRQAKEAPAPADFSGVMERPGRIHLIAEIKRASPSAGSISPSLSAADCARLYKRAGADALSVLTDGRYFGGSLEDLRQAKATARLPTLRKDFFLDAYQVYEARAAGADAILLITRILTPPRIQELLNEARRLRMCAVVEVHDERDLEAALQTDARLIGINNRNLETLEVEVETTLRLVPQVPGDRVIISESGISEPEQVRRLREAGVSAILVGHSILQSPDPEQKIRQLLAS